MINYTDVKKKRQELGITQEKLAELTGIQQTTISIGERRNSKLMVGVKEVMERVFNEIEKQNKSGKLNQRITGNNNYMAGKDVMVKSSDSSEVEQLKEQIIDLKKTIEEQRNQINKLIDIIGNLNINSDEKGKSKNKRQ